MRLLKIIVFFFALCSCKKNINSNQNSKEQPKSSWGMRQYAVSCFDELGPWPSNETLDCNSKAYVEVKISANNSSLTNSGKCDEPIMSVINDTLGGCVPGTKMNHFRTEKADFVSICRRKDLALEGLKVQVGGKSTALYDAVAVIGYNSQTRKACFIERSNKIPVNTQGPYLAAAGSMGSSFVPPIVPADSYLIEKIAEQWEPMSIDCTSCHSTKPFARSPAVSQLRHETADGKSAVLIPTLPKIKPGELPYQLVDEENVRNYLTYVSPYVAKNPHPFYGLPSVSSDLKVLSRPRILLHPSTAVCTKCHDIGGREYIRKLIPQALGYFPKQFLTDEPAWKSFSQFFGKRSGNVAYNGPSREVKEFGKSFHSEKTLLKLLPPGSDSATVYGILDDIYKCGTDPNSPGCTWSPSNSVEK